MLGIGLVGCGRVTQLFHHKAIQCVEGLRIAALADPDPHQLRKTASKCGAINTYTNYQDLLADPSVDAIAVNTPPALHEEITLAGLKAGKHVVCEKPLGESLEGFRRIMRLQEETGLTVFPVHNYAFTPCLNDLRQLVLGGSIGEVQRVKASFENSLKLYRSCTRFRENRKLGVVEDLLPHLLSVVNPLAGRTQRLRSIWGRRENYPVCDNATLEMESDRGVTVEMHMSWTTLIPRFSVEVVGEGGSLEVELLKRPYDVKVKKRGGTPRVGAKSLTGLLEVATLKHPGFAAMYRHFRDVVSGVEAPLFTLEDEYHIMLALEAASKAMEGLKW